MDDENDDYERKEDDSDSDMESVASVLWKSYQYSVLQKLQKFIV